MNTVVLIGNLGDAPRIGTSKNVTYGSFNLAVSSAFKPKNGGDRAEHTDWFRIVAFNGLAQSLRALGKGDKIAVRGRLQTKTWEQEGQRRYGVEIVAGEIQFLKVRSWSEAPVEPPAEDEDYSYGGEDDPFGPPSEGETVTAELPNVNENPPVVDYGE